MGPSMDIPQCEKNTRAARLCQGHDIGAPEPQGDSFCPALILLALAVVTAYIVAIRIVLRVITYEEALC
jgi:hypothetical protein